MTPRCAECQRPLAEGEHVCPEHPGALIEQELRFLGSINALAKAPAPKRASGRRVQSRSPSPWDIDLAIRKPSSPPCGSNPHDLGISYQATPVAVCVHTETRGMYTGSITKHDHAHFTAEIVSSSGVRVLHPFPYARERDARDRLDQGWRDIQA